MPILLGLGLLLGRHYTFAPIEVTADQPDYVQIQGIPYFVQHDPQWAGQRLGGSQETLAEAGCTLVCVAMALHRLGFDWTPSQLCQRLKTAGGFTKRGHLIWKELGTVTDGRVKVRFPLLSHTQIGRELAAGRPVIAKILLSGSVQHWVLIIGQEGPNYWALDPLSRDWEPVQLSILSQKIYAIRVLEKA